MHGPREWIRTLARPGQKSSAQGTTGRQPEQPYCRKHLDAGGAFIAVGALHLSGENGLLHLLEKKGYTVKRVN